MNKSQEIKSLISKSTMNGDLCNDDLVQIIELCGRYLNIKTVANYARDRAISYQAATKKRNKIRIFDTAYIIDNE